MPTRDTYLIKKTDDNGKWRESDTHTSQLIILHLAGSFLFRWNILVLWPFQYAISETKMTSAII